MNAVEIEEAVSALSEQPFDAAEFPYDLLTAFGNKDAAIKRLRAGATNRSDIGGVCQANNIHIATCAPGQVSETIARLRASPATAKAKVKFILATDGETIEAEDVTTGEFVSTPYRSLSNHFGLFLPLAGITTVKQIRESTFDIKATGRLNRLYIELLKDNPDWATAARRPDMNHFMARLIFCFFAEDTGIFRSEGLFTATIDQMSARDSSNTHEVMSEVFRAMNTAIADRAGAGLRPWADAFPYVNGGLFSGATDCPRFSKIARSYLINIGALDWKRINPDIFGSMIQAVADDEERGALGMHYTSVPNILKVLNPLFLDDLRAQLEEAGDNPRKLLNLRNRMSKIRVFDPACGSGNFLVIAYKEIRAIEAEINRRRGEATLPTTIPLTNFRGIELRDFPAEIARLALIIAEFQCNVLYRGEQEARLVFLPLDRRNWVTQGNALQIDWLSVCPPTGIGVNFRGDDLFSTIGEKAQIDFENEGGETYICGNPPYLGSVMQSPEQKRDLQRIFERHTKDWKSLDYVAGWFMKSAEYSQATITSVAFVSTNSICQGEQVPILWPLIFSSGLSINFAVSSFKWANLASHNAGVTVVIVGLTSYSIREKRIFFENADKTPQVKITDNIGPYLVSGENTVVRAQSFASDDRAKMIRGNMPNDGGHLILDVAVASDLIAQQPAAKKFVKGFVGSQELIQGKMRFCIWIDDSDLEEAKSIPEILRRISLVKECRLRGGTQARASADAPHRFVFAPHTEGKAIVVPRVSSENRDYLPVGLTDGGYVISERNFALYDAPLWNMALIASRLHWVWIGTVCVRMRTDFSYSNTLGWNTFPVPPLTEKNKADLTRCAENILLARETHFPATIADLYNPETMPKNLRDAHEANDETLERIYIGRRFKNDTERLEKLFEMYTKMTQDPKRARPNPKMKA